MSRLVAALAALILPAVLCSNAAHAQQAPPEPTSETPSSEEQSPAKRKALKAFHGPDKAGKDGPMAKAGLDLALLYFRYREHQKKGGDFEPNTVYQITENNSVVVDAIAQAGSTRALRKTLARLGTRDLAAAGRIVSGRLPIERIPEAAGLSSLRSLRPSVAQTQLGKGRKPSPAQREPNGNGGGSSGLLGWVLLLLGVLLLIEGDLIRTN